MNMYGGARKGRSWSSAPYMILPIPSSDVVMWTAFCSATSLVHETNNSPVLAVFPTDGACVVARSPPMRSDHHNEDVQNRTIFRTTCSEAEIVSDQLVSGPCRVARTTLGETAKWRSDTRPVARNRRHTKRTHLGIAHCASRLHLTSEQVPIARCNRDASLGFRDVCC